MKPVCKNLCSNVCYSLKQLFCPFPSSLHDYEMLSFKQFSGIKIYIINPYTDRIAGWNPAKFSDA